MDLMLNNIGKDLLDELAKRPRENQTTIHEEADAALRVYFALPPNPPRPDLKDFQPVKPRRPIPEDFATKIIRHDRDFGH